MKNIKSLSLITLLAGTLLSSSAMADGHGYGHGGYGHGHVGIGFYFGAPYSYRYVPYPYYAPYPYYPPYAYYPPAVITQADPPVYIEQNSQENATPQATAPQSNNYWYHCDKPEGYYPYIKECANGWKPVPATPPQ